MRTLLVDDEASARSRLERLLTVHPYIQLVGEAHNGLDAVKQVEQLRPELVFLDVEMPGLNGFEVLKSIRDSISLPLVIFVTGYDEHALAAFEANALAYLLKPVEPERLKAAIDRAYRLTAFTEEHDHARDVLMRIARGTPTVMRHVVCRRGDRLLLMGPEQILWFHMESGIVRARTATESFWVNYQLGELERSLPANMFFRARREVLVNLTRIRELRPDFKSGFVLVMADAVNTEIAVSERRAKPLRARLPGL
jgi:two-component system, LytTR family, response regulator